MVRDLTNEENQAESAPELDTVMDGDAVPQFVQYRGRSTNVTVDDFNLIFTTERRNEHVAHKPLPVATEDDVRAGESPRNAVVLPVAAELVRTTNLFGFGVACEHTDPETGDVCGKVFETKKALDGHQSSHRDTPDEDGDNEGDS